MGKSHDTMEKRKHSSKHDSSSKRKKGHSTLQSKLTKMGCRLDNLSKTFSKKLLLHILGFLPEIEALCSLVCTSKTWFVLFCVADYGFYKHLSDRLGEGKFAFMSLLKPTFSTTYYLTQWGANFCSYCGMYSGPTERNMIPISVYVEIENQYFCINPACKHVLDRQVGTVALDEVFRQCIKSSRKEPKEHSIKELDRDFLYPGKIKCQDYFDACTRCGLLVQEKTRADHEYCDGCCHLKENCTCAPCVRCELLPIECNCTICGECNRCSGCKRCTQLKRNKCKCSFCDDCGLLERKCEC